MEASMSADRSDKPNSAGGSGSRTRKPDETKENSSGAPADAEEKDEARVDRATGQVMDPDDEVEEGSEDSFPASDPPAW